MSITRYGADVLIRSLAVLGLIGISALFFVSIPIIKFMVIGFSCIGGILILNFFRDPDRITPEGEHLVISPADGKIVMIKDVFEPEFLGQEAVQVSIFMSPLNVHVNRFPISGTVRFFKHVEGKYYVAFNDKSSELNERTLIGIERGSSKVLCKQIAGAVARRIVAPVTIGQTATAGDRFGMIKFGSRVDVLMPKHTSVKVKLLDRVIAGETVLAETSPSRSLPTNPPSEKISL